MSCFRASEDIDACSGYKRRKIACTRLFAWTVAMRIVAYHTLSYVSVGPCRLAMWIKATAPRRMPCICRSMYAAVLHPIGTIFDPCVHDRVLYVSSCGQAAAGTGFPEHAVARSGLHLVT